MCAFFAGCSLMMSIAAYADDGFDLQSFDPNVKSRPVQQQPTIPSPALIQKNANQLYHHEGDPIVGNAEGGVTLVEFFDYRCIHSANSADAVNNLIKNNSNLRVIFKEYPIFGGASIYAAKAALAANKQGKFIELHNALFKAGKGLTESKVIEIAKAEGLDIKQLQEDMKSTAIQEELQAAKSLALNLKLKVTPAFIIGKTSNTNTAKTSTTDYFIGEIGLPRLQKSVKNKS